jgi:hypothetical protein
MLRAKYSSETVLSRWDRIASRLLCVIFAALSVWSFADGEHSTAGLQLAFAVFWAAGGILGQAAGNAESTARRLKRRLGKTVRRELLQADLALVLFVSANLRCGG